MQHSIVNRRDLLTVLGGLAGWATLARGVSLAAEPHSIPAVPLGPSLPVRAKPAFFEVSASLYAWDLADEGIERILDNLQAMTACNSTYLIALMHHEKRPLTDLYYPHNPVRKTYVPEDSRAYWKPDAKFYGRIRPLTSERAFLRGTDWLRMLVAAARARGMKTGVELSHTLLDLDRAAKEFPDTIQQDIYGRRIGKLLCFNSRDAREYIVGLFADLATNYDVDYIQTCLIPFDRGRDDEHAARRLLGVTLGGCFCPSCKQAARERGIDLERIQSVLRPIADRVSRPTLEESHRWKLLAASNTTAIAALFEAPELFQWLLFRRDSLTRLFKEVHDRIHAVRAKIDLRLNAYISADQELAGIDLAALKPHLDSIRSSDYSEQTGDPERLEHKRQFLMSIRQAVGDDMPFLSAIGVRPKATPELVRRGVIVSKECGVDGITMGHYDGAPFRNLRAIREGMQQADIEFAEVWNPGARQPIRN